MTQARLLIEELTNLVERKVHYFHGTSTKFLREILKKGFVPDPKKKVWNAESGSLESYYGTYFTDNFMTAYRSAGDASRKLGGERVIFEVQLETRTGLADEDEVGNPYYYLRQVRGVSMITPDNAKAMVHSFDPSQDPGDRFYPTKDFDKEVVDPTFDLWVENQDKKMGGLSKLEISAQKYKQLKPYFKRWLQELLKAIIHHDRDQDPESLNLTTPELKKAKGEFIKKYGSQPLGRYDGGSNLWNIRIPYPVTFKGKNRIISATEIDEEETPYKLIARYGKPSEKLLKEFGSSITSEFEVLK